MLVRPIELEETRSAGKTRCENAVAFQIVHGTLYDAEVLTENQSELTRIRALEDTEKLQDTLSGSGSE
jgi:hypothetical protein